MSNEYKDWIEDLKNAPINSNDHKRWLLIEYPWLKIDKKEAVNYLDIEDIDSDENVVTYIDLVSEGWAKLCEDLCAEIKPVLEKANYTKAYSLCQVKEKYGMLCWYDNGVPESIWEEMSDIIHKYSQLSFHTCVECGKPATKVSTGWICPFCDEHAPDASRDI